jgi:hypothetical protein
MAADMDLLGPEMKRACRGPQWKAGQSSLSGGASGVLIVGVEGTTSPPERPASAASGSTGTVAFSPTGFALPPSLQRQHGAAEVRRGSADGSLDSSTGLRSGVANLGIGLTPSPACSEAAGPGPADDEASSLARSGVSTHTSVPFYGASDRRFHLHQHVWWVGAGGTEPRAGQVTAIDRRADPLLFTVRLDGPAAGPQSSGAASGESVVSTAEGLLPALTFGSRVLVRRPPPELAPAMPPEAGHGAGAPADRGVWAAQVCGAWAAVAAQLQTTPCAWVLGHLSCLVTEGPVPLACVQLAEPQQQGQVAGAPRAQAVVVPAGLVTPVWDTAEGSGAGRSQPLPSWGAAQAGVTSGPAQQSWALVPVA